MDCIAESIPLVNDLPMHEVWIPPFPWFVYLFLLLCLSAKLGDEKQSRVAGGVVKVSLRHYSWKVCSESEKLYEKNKKRS